MRKILTVLALLALPAAATLAEEPAATTSAPSLEGSDCPSPFDSREAMEAAGLLVTEIDVQTTSDLPPCPTVYGCGGYNVVCRATNCHTTDTGYKACSGNGYVVSCTGGQTIHVTNCGCQEIFRALCCSQFPACLCAGCNSGSQSVSCQ